MTILRIPPLTDNDGTVASTVTVRLVDSSGRPLIGLRTTDGVPCTTCISQYLGVDDGPWELDLTPQTEIATSDGEPTFYAVSMRASDRALTWLLQLADSATAIDLVDAIGATAIDPADVLSGIVALAPVRQTFAEWADAPVLLAAGQMGIDTTRGVMRVGDGETPWADLRDYAGPGVSDPTAEAVELAVTVAAPTTDNRLATIADVRPATVDLGEGAALVIPASTGSYRAAITADAATLTLTPPASGSVEITALVRSRTVGQAALSIDTEDAFFSVSLDADTYARTAYLLIGGADVEGELTLALSDDSAADVVIPLTCVGTEWRRVAVSYRAGAAAQTLDITWAQTSATGALYWQSVAVEGPAPDAGSALLTAALQAAPSRVDLTATGRTDWALWGRTDASTIDRKAGVTAQIGTLGVTGDTAARVASAGSTWAFEDAAPAVSQELTLAGVTPFWGCGGTPVDLIPAGGLVRLWAEVFADGSATVDAAVYLPTVSTTAPPRLTTVAVTPVQVQLATGTTQQFTAAGYDQYGDSFTLAGGTWAASGGGTISTSGLFTASAVGGPYTVTYTAGDPLGPAMVGNASVTVSAASGTGLLQASSAEVADSTTVNLTSIGTDDWVHLGLADADDRNEQDGSTLIGTITRLGTGTSGRWYGAGVQPKWAWSDGTPTASEAGTYGYWDITHSTAGIGDGWAGDIAADTDEHAASFWLRAYQTTGTLSLSLSDGADEPLAINLGDLSSTKYYRVDVTYRADDTGETLDWEWVQTADPGNIGIAALALTVGSDPVELTSITWTPAAVTVMEGASTVAVPVALDQYSRPMAGTSLDLSVGAGVTATPDPVTSGAQVTITAGATAVGSYTLTAANGAIDGDCAITVEDYVEPAEYPEIAFTQSVIDQAIAQPFWSAYSGSRPLGGPLQRVILPLVARLHPTEATRNAAAARAVATADWLLAPNAVGNFRQRPDSYLFDEFQHTYTPLICFFALCRHTPIIWDAMTIDLQARMDAFVGVWAWGANMYVNPDHNNGVNAVSFNGLAKNSYNRNQNTSRSVLPALLAYYGGLSAYNAHLATYSSTLLDATAGPNGYNFGYLSNIRSAAAIASFTSGAAFAGTGGDALGSSNTYNSQGAKRALSAYKGRCVPASPASAAASNWVVGSAIATLDPAGILIRNDVEGNYALTVIDSGCSLGNPAPCASDPYGHIRPGYTSPYLGEAVMAQEYHITTRSMQHYVMTCAADCTVPVLATLMALGWWKSPDAAHDAALAHLRKGLSIVRYRDGHWWNPGACAYEAAQSPYWMGPYGWEIFDRMVAPQLNWPGENA